jgi:rare lipoprotein A (peptidoglycan hydrolase)
MQTKLRAALLLFAVSLLWMPSTFAATQRAKAQKLIPVKLSFLGTASWYGRERQGHKMANGEKFDRYKLTAACWFLPLDSKVRVINIKNGKEVEVKITDRGPAPWLRRIIDLSQEAANQLGYYITGTAPVFLQPVLNIQPENSKINEDLVVDSIE